MKKASTIIALVILVLASCKDDDPMNDLVNEIDYLIFGHFYGECIGEECVETFKLTATKLYEDMNDSYSAQEPFDLVELENDEFLLAEGLLDILPSQLLNETDDTFGCPDCADQGGLHIQYSSNGIVQFWRIDQAQNAVPAYLHEFMDEVNAVIATING